MIFIEKIMHAYKNSNFSLKIENISLNYGIVGILGRNGSGKTTFLNCLAGLATPNDSRIYINNEGKLLPYTITEMKNTFFYVPYEHYLFDELTVEQNLSLFCDIRFGKSELWREYKTIIEKLEIDSCLKNTFKSCSSGTKKKVEIICSLISNVKILIFDEPYNTLDVFSIKIFNDILVSFSKDKLIILSSHVVDILERIADRVLILERGSIIEDLTMPISKRLEEYYYEKLKIKDSDSSLNKDKKME